MRNKHRGDEQAKLNSQRSGITGPDFGDASRFNLEDIDMKEAARLFRKLNTKTSYCAQFGEPPKAEEDYVVMKERKFRELDYSKPLKEMVSIYVEKWLLVGQEDELISTVYFTLRDLYTFIKANEIPNTTTSHFFTGRKADKVPRFDKIIAEAV